MTNRTRETTDSPEKQHVVWSLLRHTFLWFATLNFWVIFAGFVIFGLVAMQTETLDSFAVVFFLLAGIPPVVFQTIETDEEAHGYAYEVSHSERIRYIVSTLGWSVTP